MVRLDINLLPPKRGALTREERGLVLGLVFFVLFLILIYLALNTMVVYTQGELEQVQKELQLFAPLEKQAKELESMEKQIRNQELYLSGLLNKLNDWHAFMTDLARHVPTKVSLSSLSVDREGKVSMKGNAPSLLDVSRFYFSLTGSNFLENISINSVTPQSNEWVFEFSCSVRRATP
jgi:Tfp pilus assembly protein PilN